MGRTLGLCLFLQRGNRLKITQSIRLLHKTIFQKVWGVQRNYVILLKFTNWISKIYVIIGLSH